MTDSTRKLFGVSLIVLGIAVVAIAVTHAGAAWMIYAAIAAIVVSTAAQLLLRRRR